MRELFRKNLPLAQFVLRIITGIEDLVLTDEETQYDMKRLVGARSICLDVFGTDSQNRKFNLEVQRADSGARPKRARYHSSAMDVEFLDKNQDFEDLPITYTIFITENDVFNTGNPIYPIERINMATGKTFDDDEHIIYVNGAYVGDSDLGKLVHDFRCSNADDMYFDILAERTRYFKEDPKGVSYMCKLMEDRVKENRLMEKAQIAINLILLGSISMEDIAKATGLTLKDVLELREQVNTPA
ncbi:MAG: PD-(D/E)XK nuclease family transposase [Ruminiclostridium sp.]|nr:PD-(D/E)XK nuclease family transposase [Ruminiclostridium sp.]